MKYLTWQQLVTEDYTLQKSRNYRYALIINNPVEYLTTVITNKALPHDTQAQLSTEATSDENTYQPLIPARGKEKTISTEYQLLTQFVAIQPPNLPPPSKNSFDAIISSYYVLTDAHLALIY